MKTVSYIEKNGDELIKSTHTNVWSWKVYYEGPLTCNNVKKIIFTDTNNNTFELNADNLIRFEAGDETIIAKNKEYKKYVNAYLGIEDEYDDNIEKMNLGE